VKPRRVRLIADDDRPYELLDMHNAHVCYVNADEARGLLKDGHARTYGTKKKTHGLRLIVPLSKVTGQGGGQRALTPASYTGTRYIFKQKVRTRTNGTQGVFRLKALHVTESPEHALRRILTAPALEAARHQLFYECSLEERALNPRRKRRQNVSAIFRISAGLKLCPARSAARSAGGTSPAGASPGDMPLRRRTPTRLATLVSEAQKARMKAPFRFADGAIATPRTATTGALRSADGRSITASVLVN